MRFLAAQEVVRQPEQLLVDGAPEVLDLVASQKIDLQRGVPVVPIENGVAPRSHKVSTERASMRRSCSSSATFSSVGGHRVCHFPLIFNDHDGAMCVAGPSFVWIAKAVVSSPANAHADHARAARANTRVDVGGTAVRISSLFLLNLQAYTIISVAFISC